MDSNRLGRQKAPGMDGGDGCVPFRMCLIPLNSAPKHGGGGAGISPVVKMPPDTCISHQNECVGPRLQLLFAASW